jgi:hypothetical protein
VMVAGIEPNSPAQRATLDERVGARVVHGRGREPIERLPAHVPAVEIDLPEGPRFELLDAGYPRVAGTVRSVRQPAAGMRVPGRQVPGTLRPGHWHAPADRTGTASVARTVAMRHRHLRSAPRRHRAG